MSLAFPPITGPTIDAEGTAAALARHHREVAPVPGPILADYAETPRTGDWSLRGALVRFAQPEPTLAGAVLDVVRRTDGALHPHRRQMATDAVATAPDLGADNFREDGDRWVLRTEAPVLDARATDLARLLVRLPVGEDAVRAYAAAGDLSDEEVALVQVLVAAVILDDLAETLAGWAHDRSTGRPTAQVEAVTRRVHAHLVRSGVPPEHRSRGRPGGRRR